MLYFNAAVPVFRATRRVGEAPAGHSRLHGVSAAGLAVAILMAGLLGLQACSPPSPPPPDDALYVRDVSGGIHDAAPVRGVIEGLKLTVGEDRFACSMCHDGFTGELQERTLEGQHAHIVFDHGLNVSCLNCHNPEDSDNYVAHDGSLIHAEEPNTLCSKCHGVHYRHWRQGIHGRRGPYWDEAFGTVVSLDCIQCHDPHRPRFQPMAPDPPARLTRFDPLPGQAGDVADDAPQTEHVRQRPNAGDAGHE